MCFRSAGRVHRRVGFTDCLRQRSGGPSGAGAGSLLHAQRSVGSGGAADRQLQVQRSRHPADVTVASRSVELRKQPGNEEDKPRISKKLLLKVLDGHFTC